MLWILVGIVVLKSMNQFCYSHYKIIQYEDTLRYIEGPLKQKSIDDHDQGLQKFILSFWM